MQVYSGLEADEVTNGIMVDAIQDVVEENMMGDVGLSVETQVSGGEDNMETIEAAEALLNMESPNNILDEKRMIHTYGNMLESELTYISLRPEQLSNGCMDVPLDEETSSLDEIPQKNLSKPARKSKVRKPRPVRPCSPITNPTLPLKKKSKEGKGMHNLGSAHRSKGEKVGNYGFSVSRMHHELLLPGLCWQCCGCLIDEVLSKCCVCERTKSDSRLEGTSMLS
ncbi:hypothetical protein cypCar_00004215 [Cyprinus carpio]|nr:hypothetical protein cypCar_00004215 [Cyprinus carpio]